MGVRGRETSEVLWVSSAGEVGQVRGRGRAKGWGHTDSMFRDGLT